MDSLPVEIALKILQKTDVSTVQKLKYINHKLSSIISKYMAMYEAKEIRIDQEKKTIIFHDDHQVVIYPDHKSFVQDSLREMAMNVKHKVFAVETLTVQKPRKYSSFVCLEALIKEFPRLRIVRSLRLVDCVPSEQHTTLASIIQFLYVESIEIVSESIVLLEHLSHLWTEMLAKHITLEHIFITTIDYSFLNERLRCYLKSEQVNSLELSKIFCELEDFEVILSIIQDGICGNRSINWTFTIKKLYKYSHCFCQLRSFIKINDLKVSECEIEIDGKIKQKLVVHLPESQVNFFMPGSYLKWSARKRPYIQN